MDSPEVGGGTAVASNTIFQQVNDQEARAPRAAGQQYVRDEPKLAALTWDAFIKYVAGYVQASQPCNAILNFSIGTGGAWRINAPLFHGEADTTACPGLSILLHAKPFNNDGVVVEGLMVNRINIEGFAGRLDIRNCVIRRLELLGAGSAFVSIQNSAIGRLDMKEGARELVIRSSSIDRVRVHEPKPVTSHIRITPDTVLANYGRPSDDFQIQQYRTLHECIEGRSDELTRALVHAAALRLERPREPFVFRALNAAFDYLTNYGNSPARGLLSMFCTLLALTVVTFYFDWAHTSHLCKAAQGWHVELCSTTESARWLRAWLLNLQTVYNPLALFSVHTLVIPASWAVSVAMAAESIFMLSLVAVIVIGIRRRFKVG